MRVPAAFIFSRSRVVTGFGASDMGGRQGVELYDLTLPEIAVRQLGVRHGELRGGDDAIAKTDDVEIEGARAPALAALAPRFDLDRAAVLQQLERLERGHEQDHLIEVGPLRHRSQRCGLFDARRGDEVRVTQGGEPQPAAGQMRLPAPQIRAQRHIGALEIARHSTLANPRVRSRNRPATSSRSRVARSRSESPVAASPARADTPSASARFCNEIAATALMRWRSRPNASSCSPAVDAMRCACAVASAVARTIASSASSASDESSSTPATLTCPRRICSTTSPTWRWMSATSSPASAAAPALCSARRRTSSATTANPLPCFPARAASMAAFNASRLVMSENSRIDAMKPVMRRLITPSCCTLPELSPTNALRATSRVSASLMRSRLRLATSLA